MSSVKVRWPTVVWSKEGVIEWERSNVPSEKTVLRFVECLIIDAVTPGVVRQKVQSVEERRGSMEVLLQSDLQKVIAGVAG